MSTSLEIEKLRVADECWIALVLLQQERPEQPSFAARDIIDRLRKEQASSEMRQGINPHIYQHNVANVPPSSARYRMFYRLPNGTLRLFRPGDDYDATRTGKTKPRYDDLPPRYRPLLDWYENEYCAQRGQPEENDPVLQMLGLGKELWQDEGGDAFIERERNGWEEEEKERLSPYLRRSPLEETAWERIVANHDQDFHTVTGLLFTYVMDGNSGIRFLRNGKPINRRLTKTDVGKAISKLPLRRTADLQKMCQAPAYLFALLMDGRIRGNDW